MSDNKRYYYLKFKENYFEQDQVKAIESMANGFEYSLILIKLYLKSLKHGGNLRINERIPYCADKIDMLAGAIGHQPANVMHAINMAKDLGIVEILDNREIWMADIQSYIGHSSTESERKSAYRKRIENTHNLQSRDKNGTLSQIRPPELELEIDLEKEIELEKDKDHAPSLSDSTPHAGAPQMICIGGVYQITTNHFQKLAELYQHLDIIAELKKAAMWLDANPGRRKTPKGMPRFINSWIERAQNSAKTQPSGISGQPHRRNAAEAYAYDMAHAGQVPEKYNFMSKK